jgi:hypothetical protein
MTRLAPIGLPEWSFESWTYRLTEKILIDITLISGIFSKFIGQTSVYRDIMGKTWKTSVTTFHICSLSL